jgi:FMN phosphatase YigB (HAD superfamily)
VRARAFDAYGTLFDFAAAAKGCHDVLGESIDKLTALWRDKQLQYTWPIEEVGVYKPHPKVYQSAVDRLGVPAGAVAYESSMPGMPMHPRRAGRVVQSLW